MFILSKHIHDAKENSIVLYRLTNETFVSYVIYY